MMKPYAIVATPYTRKFVAEGKEVQFTAYKYHFILRLKVRVMKSRKYWSMKSCRRALNKYAYSMPTIIAELGNPANNYDYVKIKNKTEEKPAQKS